MLGLIPHSRFIILRLPGPLWTPVLTQTLNSAFPDFWTQSGKCLSLRKWARQMKRRMRGGSRGWTFRGSHSERGEKRGPWMDALRLVSNHSGPLCLCWHNLRRHSRTPWTWYCQMKNDLIETWTSRSEHYFKWLLPAWRIITNGFCSWHFKRMDISAVFLKEKMDQHSLVALMSFLDKWMGL